MGFDNKTIIHELVADISFISIFIHLDQTLIIVSKINISSYEGCYSTDPEYLSILITKYADKRSLFIQSIEDECSLNIYNETIKLYHNKDTILSKIWETINILKKYNGVTLFGITDYNI
jgi:hypothetical protein